MANHSPYPHQTPGPSNYYQPSPSPHSGYGGHSPAPHQNFYPYPATPPMVAHPAPPYHQPPPSRGTQRGGHMNGSYNSRGAHHFHHSYHPQSQQPPPSPYSHSPGTSPLNLHPPHPQHAPQHMPYSPQFTKYVQPYSPSYHYPSPTAPVFTPSWQTQQQQQPLSLLPKQLSAPPPQNAQSYYDPSRIPQSQTSSVTHSPAHVPAQPAHYEEEEPTENIPSPPGPAIPEGEAENGHVSEDVAPSPEPAALPETPLQTENSEDRSIVIPSSTRSYSQMGSILASELSALSSSSMDYDSSQKNTSGNLPQWTIWSRRPQDPSHAPGIIISTRAHPPPDVVQQALELDTPPPSPPPPTLKQLHALPVKPDVKVPVDNSWSSQTNSTVPSSCVTETTDTPTVPGSPVSSRTSVSMRGTPVKETLLDDDTVLFTPQASSSSVPEIVLIEEATTSSEPVSDLEETTTAPTTVDAAPVTEPETSPPVTNAPPSVSSPEVVSPTPTAGPAPPKKSWASLLRPSSSTSPSATPGPSRNALPTSAVVGFSIPASSSPSNPAVPVNPSQKSELYTLLSKGPVPPPTGFAAAAAPSSPSTSMKIRPRGLVNSGNMCFANAVLQSLVYCPPFHKLFVELGRLLVGPVVGVKDEVKSAGGSTPLVDATAAFLQEFLDDKDKKKAALSRTAGRGAVNGAGGSGNGAWSAKGKEKEVLEVEVDDWDGDSFLPGYVYDAMKTKKIFDTMRGGHQEDAEEFLGFYLDTLEDELLSLLHSINPLSKDKENIPSAVEEREESAPLEDNGWLEVGKRNRTVVTRTIKAAESPITRIFGGKFRTTLRAPSQKDSVIVEDWRSLRLDIQREQTHSIQDALSYISHPQPVQVNPKPGVTIEAQQQMLIEALPPILILHIKRFCYDTTVKGVVKVSKHVRFTPELEIGSDVLVPAVKKSQPARYKLFGAVYHHGHSAAGGHYTLDVLHPNRYPSPNPSTRPVEGWVRIDDELVSDIRPEDVFKAPEQDDMRCAYLLFYRRV